MIKRFLYDLKNKLLSPYHMMTKRGWFIYDERYFKYFRQNVTIHFLALFLVTGE